eukprot:TRINITY_DN10566_c0_g1_i2.p1 TRINITY_DN10566_c0_g1~~TRINITY_DN10566_c0_g1_i2.p1  ORF type:complete len:1689 (-),score=496.42 TRINITY_DN10566_c0_g1_i2:113-5179(-)
MERWLRRVLLLLCGLLCAADGQSTYHVSCPKKVSPGRTAYCYASVGVVELQLVGAKDGVVKASAGSAQYDQPDAPGLFGLPVAASVAEGKYVVKGLKADGTVLVSLEVEVVQQTGVLLMSTDKALYKPGQEAKVRVLNLDAALKPTSAAIEVTLQNPERFKILQQTVNADQFGVAELSIPLAQQTVEGTYKLSASVGETLNADGSFEVKEYVLPKFEVKVELDPKELVAKDTRTLTVRGKAYGEYTYGEKVPGKLTLKLYKGGQSVAAIVPVDLVGAPMMEDAAVKSTSSSSSQEEDPRLLQTLTADLDSSKNDLSYDFSFEVQTDKLTWCNSGCNGENALTVAAVLVDVSTGTTQSADEAVSLHWSAEMTEIETKPSFKPGLPHEVKVTVRPPTDSASLPASASYTLRVDWRRGHSQTSSAPDLKMIDLGAPGADGTISKTVLLDIPTEDSECCDPLTTESDWKKLNDARQCCVTYLDLGVKKVVGSEKQNPGGDAWGCSGRAFSVSGHYMALELQGSAVAGDGSLNLNLRAASTLAAADGKVVVSAAGRLLYAGSASLTNQAEVAGSNPKRFEADVALALPAALLVGATKLEVVLSLAAAAPSTVVLADSTEVDVPTASSQAYLTQVSWDKEQCKPADNIKLNVTSEGSSRVFLLGVDKAVELLAGDKQPAAITFESLQEKLKTMQALTRPPPFASKMCPSDTDFLKLITVLEGVGTVLPAEKDLVAVPCPSAWPSSYCGGGFAGGGEIMMDAMVMERAAPEAMMEKGVAGGAAADSAESSGEMTSVSRVRTFFPETWIHEAVDVPAGGSADVNLTVPDSITSWRVAAFATHPTAGFSDGGLTDWLQVKKDVFVSLSLPSSVVRGERPTVTLTARNYLDSDLGTVRLTLELDEGFTVVQWPAGFTAEGSKATADVQISSKGFWTGKVILQPTKVSVTPGLSIYFSAQTAAAIGESDAVQRRLMVKPSGKPEELSQGEMLQDPTEMLQVELAPSLSTASEGSAYARVSVTGDIIGNALANLESLVRVPTGCGEQTMLGLAPNVYVGAYLQASGSLSAERRSRITRNINIGYQRELTYRHPDGGFSAFGPSDGDASTWLTAYVLKVFAESTAWVTIDSEVLRTAGQFLVKTQAADGSFKKVGRVIHEDMMGGATDTLALSAFVTSALAAAVAATSDESLKSALSKAVGYLAAVDLNSVAIYTKLLVLKARAAGGGMTAKEAATQALALRSSGGYWEGSLLKPGSTTSTTTTAAVVASSRMAFMPWKHRPVSLDVEASAYGVLILVEAEKAGDALPSAQWLISKQNGQGGWVSTQDTVIGLESLSALAKKMSGSTTVTCNIKRALEAAQLPADGSRAALEALASFTVDASNADVMQMVDIPAPELAGSVHFECTGAGVVVAAVLARWNVDADEEPAAFKVSQQWLALKTDASGNRRLAAATTPQKMMKVKACAQVNESSASSGLDGYHIFRLGLYSGYIADKQSVTAYDEECKCNPIKRVDLGDGYVDVYLDRFPKAGICVTADAERVHVVDELQPVLSEVYDYYNPERRGGDAVSFAVASDPERDVSLPSVSSTSSAAVATGSRGQPRGDSNGGQPDTSTAPPAADSSGVPLTWVVGGLAVALFSLGVFALYAQRRSARSVGLNLADFELSSNPLRAVVGDEDDEYIAGPLAGRRTESAHYVSMLTPR